MDAKDERSKDLELAPATMIGRKPRTLSQAVEAYWQRVSDEMDGPHAHPAGGELL